MKADELNRMRLLSLWLIANCTTLAELESVRLFIFAKPK
jgi:hypothetical protein